VRGSIDREVRENPPARDGLALAPKGPNFPAGVLNHTIDDVAEIYDRHDYTKEKRAAMDRLARRS
jgi:hypothetical protein